MKILVTGSEGNIGSKLVPYLKSKGHEVLCLDFIQRYRENYLLADILNLSDVEKDIIEFNPDVVYHLAGMVSRITCEKSMMMAINTNVAGTANIIQLCKRLNARLINFSTSEVYGNRNCFLEESIAPIPNNVYGLSKYMAEQLIEHEFKNGLRYINVRPFMIYDEDEAMGENRSAMIRFAEKLCKREKITVHLSATRSWLHISDAVELFEKLLSVPESITINIGNPDFKTIECLAIMMCEYIGIPETIIQFENIPDKMTLTKIASFSLQDKLLNSACKISLEEGIKLVIDKVKQKVSK